MEAKERPVVFHKNEVRATLEGRQFQFRRVVNPQPDFKNLPIGSHFGPDHGGGFRLKVFGNLCIKAPYNKKWLSPYGNPGDRLWVQETIQLMASREESQKAPGKHIHYCACHGTISNIKKIPSTLMPRWASRMTLEIINIRVERLQEITNSDAKVEGVPHAHPHRHGPKGIEKDGEEADPYGLKHDTGWEDCWICAYKELWDSIYGNEYPWKSDPWTWIVKFKRL